ncbi:uncharacterized protein LOC111868185 isoform X2 [Cryptotermes secundus]|uniref:uncharacterized protein LOC111868185 isoform X2 n=1 Tax=Cryptotermes secundus TaxID=105785 RepID=UPI000CD7D47C|nr:uncharacterized protein LOC111868185 isoform X2 [Cryptotermes secundus]
MDLSDSCALSNERSSPPVVQADGVDKVTATLENITLADTKSKNYVTVVQNTVQYHSIESTCSGTVQINSHSGETSETETQEPVAAIDDENFLREQLKSLECPFTWNLQNEGRHETSDSIITRLSEKIEEIVEEGAFQWRTFTLLLIICYENFRKGDITEAWDKQRECEKYLNPSDSKGIYESFFLATKDALFHVIYACKCHLFFESGVLNEARQTLHSVCKFEEMDNSCKAAIWGVRAVVSMEYGYQGTKAAVEYIEKALELDPEQGEWHFLYGKCLGRIRRIYNFNEIPPQKELKALENAAQMTKNASYIIFLAQAYREASFRVFSIHRNDLAPLKGEIDKMCERSAELYRLALDLRGECAHINIRCAQGFCKLPYPHKNIALAKKCCKKALYLAPNNAMANHVAGSICEKYESDLQSAKKYYQMAGDQGAYGAFMDLYRLKYNEDQTYDPIPDFEFLLSRFREKPLVEEIICQMGAFYLFMKDDLPMAYRKYYSKVISQNPESEKLKTHKCNFLPMKKPVNIYEVIFDEARIRLKEKNCKSLSDEDCKLFRQIVIEYSHLFPQLSQNSPKPRRKMVLEEAESAYSDRSRSRGGRGRGRGRGGSRGLGTSGGRSRGRADGQRDFSGGRGAYRRRFGSRDSSTDSKSSNMARYHQKAGSRDSSTEGRDRHYSKERNFFGSWHQSRDSSNDSRSSQDKNWRSGPRDFDEIGKGKLTHHRDSSNSSRYHQKAGSRDSSTERRDRHYSKERNFFGSWHQSRDSSNDSRSSQDKNWRSGPRDFDEIGKGKLTHHRDSSNSSVEGRPYPIRENNNGHQGSRTYSVSRNGSGSDLPRDLGGSRIRTESNSSVGSDTRRDWKDGCLGGGPRSRNSNQVGHGQTDEGSRLKRNFGEKRDSSSNWGSWRGYQRGGNRRPDFHGSVNYEQEARQSNMNQDSGSRSSNMHHNREQSDAMGASAARASQRESRWQGSEDKSKRWFNAKETNFKLSWQNTKN